MLTFAQRRILIERIHPSDRFRVILVRSPNGQDSGGLKLLILKNDKRNPSGVKPARAE